MSKMGFFDDTPIEDKKKPPTIDWSGRDSFFDAEDINQNIPKVTPHSKIEDIKILEGDFTKLIKDIPDNSVDLILTDPPYGQDFIPLLDTLASESQRVLKKGGWFVSYYGSYYLNQFYPIFDRHLMYYWTDSLVHTGTAGKPPLRNIRCEWKPIVLYYKPPLKEPQECQSDLIQGGGRQKGLHKWEQSVKESRYLLRIFTKENDLVLDPLAGSGTVLHACYLENRKCIGFDIDPEAIATTKKRLAHVAQTRKYLENERT